MSMNFAPDKSCNNIFDAFAKALVNYFNFKGRTSRYDYWGFCFVNFLINAVLTLAGLLIIRKSPGVYGGLNAISTIYGVLMIIPWIAAMSRRLHDTDRSALKWLLAFPLLVLLLGFIVSFMLRGASASIIVVSLLICAYMLTLLVLLCFRGSEKDNKHGAAVAEDAGQRWKGLAMPVCMIIIPIVASLAVGALSGYSKAMNKYKTEREVVPAIYDVLSRAKGQDGSDAIVNFDPQSANAQPVGVMTITPSGNKVEVKRAGDFYEVTADNISESLCMALFGYNWYEHPDFEAMGINDGKNCQICVSAPCKITWRYK